MIWRLLAIPCCEKYGVSLFCEFCHVQFFFALGLSPDLLTSWDKAIVPNQAFAKLHGIDIQFYWLS